MWRFMFGAVLCLVAASRADDAAERDWEGWSCDDMTPNLCDDLQVSTGRVQIPESPISVKYWRYNSETEKDDEKLPVVVVNGGPGYPHNYDLPLKQMACRGHEVIFYDQAGAGKSALPANTTVQDFPFLLEVSYYAERELPSLIEALDIDNYHLVTDSWGTMICLQFALESKSPARDNLVSVTLDGPIPNAFEFVQAQWDSETGTIGTMPDYFQERLRIIAATGDFDSPELEAMEQVVMTEFYSRNGIFPDCVQATLEGINADIYLGMWGAVDYFNVTGTLKDFNVMPHLSQLDDLPILLTCGEFDLVRPHIVLAIHQKLSRSEMIVFKGSGHGTVIDVPGPLTTAIDEFLTGAEASLILGRPFVPAKVSEHFSDQQELKPRIGVVVSTGIIAVVGAFGLGYYIGKRGQGASGYQRVA